MQPSSYLEGLEASLLEKPVQSIIGKAKKAARDNLWSELGDYLLLALEDSTVRAAIHDIYENVVRTVRTNLSSFVYVKLLLILLETPLDSNAPQLEDGGDPVTYVLALLERALKESFGEDTQNRQSKQCIRCLQALALMHTEPVIEARRIIAEVGEYKRTLQTHELEPTLAALHAKASLRECELLRDFSTYYKRSFEVYDACCNAQIYISSAELSQLAYKTTVAALLSTTTYNFGQLLTFEAYTRSLAANDEWLLQWAQICNDGDVAAFEVFVKEHAADINEIPDIASAMTHLERKVRLMALLHLVFHTPAEQRIYTFARLAERCRLHPLGVEPLLLTALANKLIRGTLDGEAETIHITWVQPRVLSPVEIKELAAMIGDWRSKVSEISMYNEKMAEKLSA